MTIDFTTTRQAIKRHLSIIGKRLYDKDGKNLFSNITTSTAEDPIFEQYMAAGAQNVEALLRPLVTAYSTDTQAITISLANTRGTGDFDARCGEMINTYITLFSVGEYLMATHPELAEKYRADAANALLSVQLYAFHKDAPQASASSYNDINGTTT
ncbi:MAG: hypothetical protein IJ588_08770 [Prevotella sp.]|nr:hypothetical protein [Prevotella sp.]